MIKKIILFCCLFTFASVSGADFMVKAGMNYSQFATEGSSSEIAMAGGIGWQFPLGLKKKYHLGVDILFTDTKMLLKNKTWLENWPNENECVITAADIHLHYAYIKLPICFSYKFLNTKDILYRCKIGYSKNFTFGGSGRSSNRHVFTAENCEYNYDRIEADSNAKFPDEFLLGMELIYKRLMIDISYAYTLSKTERFYGLTIQDNVHSVRILTSWKLN